MIKHILVPLDRSPLAECVLPHAVALAQPFDALITLIHILEPANSATFEFIDPFDWELQTIEVRSYLEAVAQRLHQANVSVEYTLLEGRPENCIIRMGQSYNQALLLLSSHAQGGIKEWKIGSVVQKIMQRRHISTLIVRAHADGDLDLEGEHYRRVLVPLDGSQRAECVLPLVTTLAAFHASLVILAHVITEPEMPLGVLTPREHLQVAHQLTEQRRAGALQYLEQMRLQSASNTVFRVLVSDNAAAALHQLIEDEDIDLVVMSAHGYSGKIEWPYGSVVNHFITYSPTPLLIVQDCPDMQIADEEECKPRGLVTAHVIQE
jgi:nucleotide-binding universal stress UspA family protein